MKDVQMRNLLREFAGDPRVSPAVAGNRSLAGDWRVEWHVPDHVLRTRGVSARLSLVRATISADGPKGGGRILSLSSPNAPRPANASQCELERGLSLGEAYDLVLMVAAPVSVAGHANPLSSLPLDLFASRAGMSAALATDEELDEAEARAAEARAVVIAEQADRARRGRLAVRGGRLVTIGEAAREDEAARAIESAGRAAALSLARAAVRGDEGAEDMFVCALMDPLTAPMARWASAEVLRQATERAARASKAAKAAERDGQR